MKGKKTYISPMLMIDSIEPELLQVASGVSSQDNGYNMGSGGVDNEGDKEGDARQYSYSVWDDEV